MIRYFKEDTTFSPKKKRLIGKWLREVARGRGYGIGDLNYIFCSDPYLLAINRQFLDHDYYTDIITFDNSDDYLVETGRKGVSADIYISVDTVRANGAVYGEGFERELHRVMVHGLLHLIGYDDHTEADIAVMRQKENYYLQMKASL